MLVKVGILGSEGRMGKILREVVESPLFSKRARWVFGARRDSDWPEHDPADVWIDFSRPQGALEFLDRRSDWKSPLVVGSTGWSPQELRALEKHAASRVILRSANFSIGIRVVRELLRVLGSYSELSDWSVAIKDLHHSRKQDAPSGTALSLKEVLGREVDIVSVREGEAVGTHEILFESASEKILIVHEAKSRAVFAEGALEAALVLIQQKSKVFPGRLLSLDDLYLRRHA